MAISSQPAQLAPNIRSALAALRRRIRAYVWLEALSVVVIWLGLTFWGALALDYFPVLVWASEMPRAPRAVLLAIIAAGTAWVLYRLLLRRAFVPIADRSLALLIERQFGQFHDGLVTSVELAGRREASYNPQMLEHTHDEVRHAVDDLPLGRVLNYRPLLAKAGAALALVASIVGFYAVNAPALELARDRLYLLDDTPWPRSAEIEVVSLEIQHAPRSEGEAATTQVIEFDDGAVKVARGANALVRVRASSRKRIPDTCTIYYRTADGDRGSVAMKKIGRIKDGYQYYTFDGKPFKGMLADLSFDVMGYDHRVRGFEIGVVDAPAIVEASLACTFPDYLVDEELSLWLPRTETLTPATQLPLGTRVAITCRANKPLASIEVLNTATGETLSVAGALAEETSDQFSLPPITLTGNLSLEIRLLDTDGVLSDRPQRLFIPAVRDEAPRVAARLRGISTLVTPDVAIPVQGSIEDDYGVSAAWFELHKNDEAPRKLPFALARNGTIDQVIDFRDLRSESAAQGLQPTDRLTLMVVGQDKHNLEGGPHSGFGDRWELQVVTADELLASLEARELGLRRRFEQIISEMTETRDELIRAAAESKPNSADDAVETEEGLSVSLRLLIAQRALQQSQKSAQEILGVSASFADIREELINNRVDTEERKKRLKNDIADPLAAIVASKFPDLDKELETVQKNVEDTAAAQRAVDRANDILLDLEGVLARMLDLETYHELIELVRSLIEEQEQLTTETKKQQAADLLK